MTVVGKVLLGLAGVGILTVGAVAARKAFAAARELPSRPRPEIPARRPPSQTRNYVGSGWTGWPHNDVFPDEDAFVQALRRLGYDVDDDLLSQHSMWLVGDFQLHYNLWSMRRALVEGEPIYDAAPTLEEIEIDELVGEDTTEGLYDALLADEQFPGGWPALVKFYDEAA